MKLRAGMWRYVDTSALVKRCIWEPGSDAVSRATSAYAVVTSALAPLEALSAIAAKQRGGSLRTALFRAALRRLEEERRRWTLVEIVPAVLLRAESVIRAVPARTLDAIHIASALFFQEIEGTGVVFLTADSKQRQSAEAAGLTVRFVGDA
ncbi:MAG TPA: type II toxin-antitoxin system VapC family toxin [bacterium]|nr:type II toxin-antitoxin system VapC family toxin [bacterium]